MVEKPVSFVYWSTNSVNLYLSLSPKMIKMTRLSVNINKVATLRNAKGKIHLI